MQRTTATKASQFLQKPSCQKPYWDQARLSSLVNKQVGLQYQCQEEDSVWGVLTLSKNKTSSQVHY